MFTFAAVCAAVSAQGVDYVWKNPGTSGVFGTAENWSPTGCPGPGDTATIPAGGTPYTVTVKEPLDVAGLTVEGDVVYEEDPNDDIVTTLMSDYALRDLYLGTNSTLNLQTYTLTLHDRLHKNGRNWGTGVTVTSNVTEQATGQIKWLPQGVLLFVK